MFESSKINLKHLPLIMDLLERGQHQGASTRESSRTGTRSSISNTSTEGARMTEKNKP